VSLATSAENWVSDSDPLRRTRSSRDLFRALNSFIQTPTLPPPADLDAIISSYLERHDKPEEGSGDRLNDELLAIWDKAVQDHPEKYAAFVAVLRQLRPGLGAPARTFQWWDKLLDPVLDNATREKGLARSFMDFTLEILSSSEYDDPEAWGEEGFIPWLNRLLVRWMELRESQADFRPSTDLKEQVLTDALLAFGKKDPKGFMNALNAFVLRREYRNSAFSLLCAFVNSGPPHLYLILQTPLFGNILQSLQKDESTFTVNLALIALVMLLPFFPGDIVPYLPTLFNIYARLLFWDRDSYFAQQHTEMGENHGESGTDTPWDKVLLDPDYDGHSVPYLPEYFTILYGLYPINFVDYIRKPHNYLPHAGSDDDIDVHAAEIRERSERFRKQHLLHPNFYEYTIETEKTNITRWLKSEADEIMADCMALVVDRGQGRFPHARSGTPAPPEGLLDDDLDQDGGELALLGDPECDDLTYNKAFSSKSLSHSHGNSTPGRPESQLSYFSGVANDSPSPSPIPEQLPRETAQGAKEALRQSLTSDSIPSLAFGTQDQGMEKSREYPSTSRRGTTADESRPGVEIIEQVSLLRYQRHRLLNDLQYERFVRQQHMSHMGELRRRQIRVSATEAETQNLVMANRSLRQRLDEAKRGEAKIKKEFDQRRNMALKREADLSNKLRALREEQKKWAVESRDLKQQLEKTKKECASLRQIIEEYEKQRLESEQNMEAIDISTATIEKLKGEIARLTAVEREFQGKEQRMEIALQEAAATQARAEQLKMELTAKEQQMHEAHERYLAQINELRQQLTQARSKEGGGQQKAVSEVAAHFEKQLAAERQKYSELKKQYSELMGKYTVAQSKLLDLESRSNERAGGGAQEPALPGEHAAGGDSVNRSPIAVRPRTRSCSETETPECMAQVSPPTDPASGSLGSMSHRPVTPGEGRATGSQNRTINTASNNNNAAAAANSPLADRYIGRGEP